MPLSYSPSLNYSPNVVASSIKGPNFFLNSKNQNVYAPGVAKDLSGAKSSAQINAAILSQKGYSPEQVEADYTKLQNPTTGSAFKTKNEYLKYLQTQQPANVQYQSETVVASSVVSPTTFITNKGRLVNQQQVSAQVLPVTTKASSLPTKSYVQVQRETRPINVVNMKIEPSNQDNRNESFFGPRKAAIERLRNQGPIQNVVGAGVAGLYGVSELIVTGVTNPSKVIDPVTGLGAEFLKNPVKTTTKVGVEQFNAFKKDPVLFIGANVTAGQSIGVIASPGTRLVKTKFSYLEERVSPDFLKNSNIELVTGQPPRESIQSLLTKEGKTIDVIHVSRELPLNTTTGKVKSILSGEKQSIILKAVPQKVGSLRSQVEQFSFYRSTPNPVTGEPRALLYFAGLSKGEGLSGKIAIPQFGFKKPINAFIETVEVKPTKVPVGTNIVQVLKYQEKYPGKTFIGAENIAKLSTEAQVTTPVQVSSFPKTGRPASIGSILSLENKEGFVFTRQSVLPESFPEILRKRSIFTETEKVNILRTKTSPLSGLVTASQSPSGIKSVNLVKAFEESSARRVPASGPPIFVSKVSSATSSEPISSPKINFSSGSIVSSNTSVISSIKSVSSSVKSPVSSSNRLQFSGRKAVSTSSPTSSTQSLNSIVSSVSSYQRSYTSPTKFLVSPNYYRSRKSSPSNFSSTQTRKYENSTINPSKRLEPGFVTVLYKRGKPTGRLAGVFTKQEAIAAGKVKRGLGGLGRSFKVVQVNTLAAPRGIRAPAGEEFRFGKRDKTLFVEESRSALSSRQERAQIQGARKLKMNKRKGFF